MRITKVVTRVGDGGETRLGDGQRVMKSDVRIECLGAIDELNSMIGFAKVALQNNELEDFLESIQQDLFNVGGCLAMPGWKVEAVKEQRIKELEKKMKQWNSKLPALKEFILPGGNEASSRMHIVRTTARKTERIMVGFHQNHPVPIVWLKYINRLSDLFFILARKLQSDMGVEEKQWNRKF